MSHRLGVDIGGTFTDFALVDDDSGTLLLHKQLTSPEDPSRSVLSGVQALLERASLPLSALRSIAHGTTLVTNAVIERKGARTGMLESIPASSDMAMSQRPGGIVIG